MVREAFALKKKTEFYEKKIGKCGPGRGFTKSYFFLGGGAFSALKERKFSGFFIGHC